MNTAYMESTGAKLSKARQARGYTLEEAGLQTRIRPSQIAALEADDYSVFPSNIYARGFLLIYGKFLAVDVSTAAHQLEGAVPLNVEEYQYLNSIPNEEAPRRASRSDYSKSVERRRPSLVPLVVFVLMLVAAGAIAHFVIQTQRLEGVADGNKNETPAISEEAGNTGTAAAPAATPAPIPGVPAEVAASDQGDREALRPPTTPVPFGAAPSVPGPFVAAATPVPAAAPAPAAEVSELVIEPLKKAWVRIRRDDPAAEPVFEDVLYPNVGALKMRGMHFWIEVREQDAISVKRNGQIVAVQPPGVEIP